MSDSSHLGLGLLVAILAGCSTGAAQEQPASAARAAPAGGPIAVATLAPTQGNTAAGSVEFRAQGDNVQVTARVTGLKPNGEHGFHVHEKGDCSAPDGMSTGGHFNPGNHPHGPQDKPHHAGDMPSLKADAAGVAEARFTLRGVTIGSGPADLVGRGVIVHVQPDDYQTQPTGNAGARIACGVIARR